MKTTLILFLVVLGFAFTQMESDSLAGKYVFKHERYIKTITLNADSTGRWSFHGYKSSAYDFDDEIHWSYNAETGKIALTRMTQSIDSRISKKGDVMFGSINGNRLSLDGSEEVYIKE